MRDSQKGRVYAAEFAVKIAGQGRLTFAEAVAYVRKVERSPWTKRQWPWASTPVVMVDRGDRREGAKMVNRRTMKLPAWARQPMVLLHELAHRYGGHHHGWEFCRTYLALVRHFEGVEAYKTLRAQFRAYRVRYKKPRKGGPGNPAALKRWRDQQQAAADPLPPRGWCNECGSGGYVSRQGSWHPLHSKPNCRGQFQPEQERDRSPDGGQGPAGGSTGEGAGGGAGEPDR